MENSDSANSVQELPGRRKGGLRTMPFVIANEAFERIASYGLQPNMILYLMQKYHFSAATGTSILFTWGAVLNFMPILGAFLSDSYFGRFRVIAMATVVNLLGLIVLWLTSILKFATPPRCDPTRETCIKPDGGQIAFLFTSFVLMAIGSGGIRPCSLAFGADQFDNPENPKNKSILQSFFNWYYASVGISAMIAVTVIVYIQTAYGWIVGFGIPVGLMLFSTIMFFLGYKLYIKMKPNKSLMTDFAQVIVASWKNRRLDLPSNASLVNYHKSKGSKLLAPTEKLRFLNKACIIGNPEKDLNPDGSALQPWSLCTIQQVEELKALIKVLPMWSTGIPIAVTISQHSFPVLLASTMDRHFIGSFQIPAASFGVFGILTLTLWVAIYDRILVRYLRKLTKNPRGIGLKQRMGIGLFISCVAMAVTALVERNRRARAHDEGLAEHPRTLVHMSAMWLIPQHCLVGLAEALNAIGQIEFYYSQFPKSMASIAVALFALGMACANLLGTLIVNAVDHLSKRGGRESWVSSNVNKGHYDYYYWVITMMSVANLFYFILCSYAYGCVEEKVFDEDNGEGLEEDNVTLVEMAKSKESPLVFVV